MSEMRERVAEALYMEGCRRAIRVGIMKADGIVKWVDLAESSRRDYRESADAAFAALYEPTEPMVGAGAKVHYGNDTMSSDDFDEQAESIWKTMMDAAQEHKTPE